MLALVSFMLLANCLLLLINLTKGSTIQLYQHVLAWCTFQQGQYGKDKWLENFVFDVFCIYVLFYICVRTNFVDIKEFCGLITCLQNNWETEVCFQPWYNLCSWLGSKQQLTNIDKEHTNTTVPWEAYIQSTKKKYLCCVIFDRTTEQSLQKEIFAHCLFSVEPARLFWVSSKWLYVQSSTAQ